MTTSRGATESLTAFRWRRYSGLTHTPKSRPALRPASASNNGMTMSSVVPGGTVLRTMTTRYRSGSDEEALPSASPMVATAASRLTKVDLSGRRGCRDGDEHNVDPNEPEPGHRHRLEALGPALGEHRLVDVAERDIVPTLTQGDPLGMADDTCPDDEHVELFDSATQRLPRAASGTIMRSMRPPPTGGGPASGEPRAGPKGRQDDRSA